MLAHPVERRAAGEAFSIQDLCGEHPSLAAELRELVPLADSLLERLSPTLGGSRSERLKEQFGSGVDPQVTLEGEGPGKGDFSTEVLSRLAGRVRFGRRCPAPRSALPVTHPGLAAG